MTRLEWPRAGILAADAGNPGPYVGGVSRDDLATLHNALVPLLRILLLIGYEVPGFSFRMPGGGPEWVRLDRYELTVSVLPGAAPGPVADAVAGKWEGPSVAVEAAPMRDARDGTTAMAIEFDPRNEGSVWHRDPGAGLLYVGYQGATASLEGHGAKDVMRSIETSVRACVNAVVADASAKLDTLDWSAWRPESGVGLFWLLDPQWWRPDVLGGGRVPSLAGQELESFGQNLRAVKQYLPGYGGYFDRRLTGVDAAERLPIFFFRENPLIALTRVALGEIFQVQGRVALFFDYLRIWLDEIDEQYKLDDATLDGLRDAPWFEVLVTLVNVGVFTPSPLVGILPLPDAAPDPVQAVRWSADVVELQVLGQLSIWLRRVRGPDGAPIPQESDIWPPADESSADTSPVEDDALLAPIDEFAWDFLIPVNGTLPVLYLVAAPGVAIDIPESPKPDGWRYEIVRVPDAALVPEWGTAVNPYWLMPIYVVPATDTVDFVIQDTVVPDPGAAPEEKPLPQSGAASAVQVISLPNGVVLSYPVYETGRGDPTLSVEITLSEAAVRSGDLRYAADIFFYEDTRFPGPVPYLSVWVTRGVDVVVRRIVNGLEDVDPWGMLSCHVWEVGDYTDIPEFGVPLPFDQATVEGFPIVGGVPQYLPDWPAIPDGLALPGGRFRALAVEVYDIPWWVYLCADVAVGMIPVVGDVLDAAEYVKAITVGLDRWGRPVTNLDLIMMGVGVLTPFVSSSLSRGMGRDVAVLFGGSIGRMGRAPVAAAPVSDIEEIVSKAVQVRTMSAAERALAEAEVEALTHYPIVKVGALLADQYMPLGDLLKAAKQADKAVPGSSELLRAFRQWLSRNPQGTIRQFVADKRAGARGRVRAIIEAMCGNDVSVGPATRRKPKAVKKWKSIDPAIRANPPAQEYVLGNLPRLVSMVEDYVTGRERPKLWVAEGLLEFSKAIPDAGSALEYAGRVRSLLASLSCGSGSDVLALGQLTRLLGDKRVYLAELARLLVTAIDLLIHDLQERATTGFPGVPVYNVGIDVVLPVIGATTRPITGIYKFFQAVITGSSPEHSARFEVLMVGEELRKGTPARMLRAGAQLPAVSDADLQLREGPDVLRYRDESGETVADILQGKSFNSINQLFATSKDEAQWLPRPASAAPPAPGTVQKNWAGPKLFAQLVSDLIRLGQADPPYTVDGPATGAAIDCPDTPVERVKFSGEIEFYLDYAYYYRNRRPWSPEPTPEYAARLAEVQAMTLAELRRLSDTEKRTYLDDLRSTLDAEQLYILLAEYIAPDFTNQIQMYLYEYGPKPYAEGGLALPADLDVQLTVHVL